MWLKLCNNERVNVLLKKKIPKKFQDTQKSPKNLQNILKTYQKINVNGFKPEFDEQRIREVMLDVDVRRPVLLTILLMMMVMKAV